MAGSGQAWWWVVSGHRAPESAEDASWPTRIVLDVKAPYTGRHVDTNRQPGRTQDGVPDEYLDPDPTRGPNDADRGIR